MKQSFNQSFIPAAPQSSWAVRLTAAMMVAGALLALAI